MILDTYRLPCSDRLVGWLKLLLLPVIFYYDCEPSDLHSLFCSTWDFQGQSVTPTV